MEVITFSHRVAQHDHMLKTMEDLRTHIRAANETCFVWDVLWLEDGFLSVAHLETITRERIVSKLK